jgi:restriction endonuclease Mrr
MRQLEETGQILFAVGRLPRLKSYLAEFVEPVPPPVVGARLIIRHAMQAIAVAVAQSPSELDVLEWRELEQMMAEVFEELGFQTDLTRSAKDGGFDLDLRAAGKRYLVELKKWTAPNVISPQIIGHFAEVVVSERAERGLLLATSGFSKKVVAGRLELERQMVALGGGEIRSFHCVGPM